MSKELCACQIHEWLGVSGATASNHLGILANAGFISSRKDGKWVHYRLNRSDPENQSLLKWVRKNISNDTALNRKNLDKLKFDLLIAVKLIANSGREKKSQNFVLLARI